MSERQKQAELGLLLASAVRGQSPFLDTCVLHLTKAVDILAFALFLHQERALPVCLQESPSPLSPWVLLSCCLPTLTLPCSIRLVHMAGP